VILPAFGMAMGLALDLTVPLHGWAWIRSFWGWTPGSVSRASSSGAWRRSPRAADAAQPGLSVSSGDDGGDAGARAAPGNRERPRERARVAEGDSPGAAIGYALYHVYPVVGPGPLFGARFPYGIASLAGPPQRLIDVTAIADPRNCMPSLHVGWALLIYWHAARWEAGTRGGRLLAGFDDHRHAGDGQHYLVDLVVAVPFAALVDALAGGASARKISARGQLIATAGVLLAVWYAILLLAPPGASGGSRCGCWRWPRSPPPGRSTRAGALSADLAWCLRSVGSAPISLARPARRARARSRRPARRPGSRCTPRARTR